MQDFTAPQDAFQQQARPSDWPTIGLFLATATALSGLAYLLILNFGVRPYVALLMWSPGLAAVLTFKIMGLKLKQLGFRWPKSRYVWAGLLIPVCYGLAAYGTVWTLGLVGAVSESFIDHAHHYLGLPRDWDNGVIVPVAILVTSATWILWHVPSALGTEIGLRGYLSPVLTERFGRFGSAFSISLLWLVWHLPLIFYTSYGVKDPALLNIACFWGLLLGQSLLMGWLRDRSNSVWPAAFLHGAHNLFILETFDRMSYNVGGSEIYRGEFGIVLPLVVLVVAGLFWAISLTKQQKD